MLLKDIMKNDVVTSPDDDTIRGAATKLANNKVGCLVIIEHGFLKGILTKSDIVRSLAEKKDPDYCKISEIMNSDIITCHPDTNIYNGAKIMSVNKVKRLPLIDEGNLKGIVSISDLAPSLRKEMIEMASYF